MTHQSAHPLPIFFLKKRRSNSFLCVPSVRWWKMTPGDGGRGSGWGGGQEFPQRPGVDRWGQWSASIQTKLWTRIAPSTPLITCPGANCTPGGSSHPLYVAKTGGSSEVSALDANRKLAPTWGYRTARRCLPSWQLTAPKVDLLTDIQIWTDRYQTYVF